MLILFSSGTKKYQVSVRCNMSPGLFLNEILKAFFIIKYSFNFVSYILLKNKELYNLYQLYKKMLWKVAFQLFRGYDIDDNPNVNYWSPNWTWLKISPLKGYFLKISQLKRNFYWNDFLSFSVFFIFFRCQFSMRENESEFIGDWIMNNKNDRNWSCFYFDF